MRWVDSRCPTDWDRNWQPVVASDPFAELKGHWENDVCTESCGVVEMTSLNADQIGSPLDTHMYVLLTLT